MKIPLNDSLFNQVQTDAVVTSNAGVGEGVIEDEVQVQENNLILEQSNQLFTENEQLKNEVSSTVACMCRDQRIRKYRSLKYIFLICGCFIFSVLNLVNY